MSEKKKVIHMSHCLLSLRDGLYDHRTRGEPGYCVGVQNSMWFFFFRPFRVGIANTSNTCA